MDIWKDKLDNLDLYLQEVFYYLKSVGCLLFLYPYVQKFDGDQNSLHQESRTWFWKTEQSLRVVASILSRPKNTSIYVTIILNTALWRQKKVYGGEMLVSDSPTWCTRISEDLPGMSEECFNAKMWDEFKDPSHVFFLKYPSWTMPVPSRLQNLELSIYRSMSRIWMSGQLLLLPHL